MLLDAGQMRMRSRLFAPRGPRTQARSPAQCLITGADANSRSRKSRRCRHGLPTAAAPRRGDRRRRFSARNRAAAARGRRFFLDIDGTLLDIAERPQLVRIDDDLGHLLATLRDASGGAVALISGRPVAEIDRYSGGISAPPDSTERSAATPREKCTGTASRSRTSKGRLKRLRVMVAEHPALVLEDKA